MPDEAPNAAVFEELYALRAEVAHLRQVVSQLEAPQPRAEAPRMRRLMEIDPELPGLPGLWRGERGLAWQLFVQAAVTMIVVLNIVAAVVIL